MLKTKGVRNNKQWEILQKAAILTGVKHASYLARDN